MTVAGRGAAWCEHTWEGVQRGATVRVSGLKDFEGNDVISLEMDETEGEETRSRGSGD